jgi:hypothetical protein
MCVEYAGFLFVCFVFVMANGKKFPELEVKYVVPLNSPAVITPTLCWWWSSAMVESADTNDDDQF